MPKHKRNNDVYIKDNVIYNTRKKTKCILHLEKDSMTGEDIIVCQVLHDIQKSNISKYKANQLCTILDNLNINNEAMEIETKPREWFKD